MKPHRPTRYAIRDVIVDPAVVLAPMEGVTDLTFRRLARRLSGPGLTYTEFIASSGLREGRGRQWHLATFDPDERPIALQIYGREPEIMAEAARILEDRGASIIDINMGCPSKRVCARSGGSALMRDPDLAADIVRAVRAAISVPLTVKMRSGFDDSLRNAPELARRCVDEGAEGITIHWRTRADGYKGQRRVDAIAATVASVPVPVIANGDIVDLDSARAMLDETRCAGLMVGRGAIANPWLIGQIGAWLRGEAVVQPTPDERRAAIGGFIDGIEAAFDTPKGALGRTKMFANYFCGAQPLHGAAFRAHVLRSRSLAAVRELVARYFDALTRHEGGDEAAFAGTPFLTTPAREAA